MVEMWCGVVLCMQISSIPGNVLGVLTKLGELNCYKNKVKEVFTCAEEL
jgi:hypothetical protein